MKTVLLIALALLMTGCASYVRSYDSGDRLLGSCVSGTGIFNWIPFLPIGQNTCKGYVPLGGEVGANLGGDKNNPKFVQ
jgi:hypothetical protein